MVTLVQSQADEASLPAQAVVTTMAQHVEVPARRYP
jgi:hypothetical protein